VYFSKMTLPAERRTDFGRLAGWIATIFGTRLAPSFGSTFAKFRRDRAHRSTAARFRANPCAERAPPISWSDLRESPENRRKSHQSAEKSAKLPEIWAFQRHLRHPDGTGGGRTTRDAAHPCRRPPAGFAGESVASRAPAPIGDARDASRLARCRATRGCCRHNFPNFLPLFIHIVSRRKYEAIVPGLDYRKHATMEAQP
jgi:hypothetical protein